MKPTIPLVLLLTILSLSLVTACAGGASVTPANADQLVNFNTDGIAVLRGRVAGDYYCSPVDGRLRGNITIEVPVRVEGIDTWAPVPFTLLYETEIASSMVTQTTLREFLSDRPGFTTFDAFPIYAAVDVTFRKTESAFEAVAIQEVTDLQEGQDPAVVDGVFSTNLFSGGVIHGTISAMEEDEGTLIWTVSVPVRMQGVEAAVLLPVNSAADTTVVTAEGMVPFSQIHPLGEVEMQISRAGDTLTAHRITEIP